MVEKRLNVRVTDDLLQRVQIQAIKSSTNVSDVVRDLLEKWLKEKEQQDQKKL